MKKTKTGNFILNSAVLKKISDEHPLPKLILEYREIQKLYSTYIVGLQKKMNPLDNKIHTTFQNTLTVTGFFYYKNLGRLSSTSPNLQNIPNKTEEGKKIKNKFIPSPGNILIKADYSQVELRILAHIANIDTLRKAFIEKKGFFSFLKKMYIQSPQVKFLKFLLIRFCYFFIFFF
jgi:DNA polymerase I